MSDDEVAARLPARMAVRVFFAFAFAYFLSALLRGVTATLAPNFSADLGLGASDLGLLGGAFFLGFASVQLPLGHALDRHGPRRVVVVLMALAVAGCAAFAVAGSVAALIAARALIGVGVSACLMAPMTTFRHRFAPATQMRANAWMLMTGSVGMVASTVPVRWLLPLAGWRGLFWMLAVMLAIAALAIAVSVPHDAASRRRSGTTLDAASKPGYGAIWRHPSFVAYAPLGFFLYGGMVAVQSLWAGPWLVDVCGRTPGEAAQGLLLINLCMLLAFFGWGGAVPRLEARGWPTPRIVAATVPVALGALVLAIALGPSAGAWNWALFCVASSGAALAQPAVAQAFPGHLAGRALSAYNLVVFAGVFAVQWGIGVTIDTSRGWGADRVSAYRAAFALLALCAALAYGWLRWRHRPAAAVSIPRAAMRCVDNAPAMPGLLIIAHAPLASALKAVAQHAFPDCTASLEALDVTPQMASDEVESKARELLRQVRTPEALIFTDVFGATPSNVAQRLADGLQVKVVAGVNVPMLWRSLCYAGEGLDALVSRAVAGATQGVMQVAASRPQQLQPVKPGGHDQGDPHHQQ